MSDQIIFKVFGVLPDNTLTSYVYRRGAGARPNSYNVGMLYSLQGINKPELGGIYTFVTLQDANNFIKQEGWSIRLARLLPIWEVKGYNIRPIDKIVITEELNTETFKAFWQDPNKDIIRKRFTSQGKELEWKITKEAPLGSVVCDAIELITQIQ